MIFQEIREEQKKKQMNLPQTFKGYSFVHRHLWGYQGRLHNLFAINFSGATSKWSTLDQNSIATSISMTYLIRAVRGRFTCLQFV